MPRPPRILLSQSYYHIMTRGNNRNVVFRSDQDYQYLFHLIAKYKDKHPFDLYHYCLMPSHTHFIVKTKKAADFSIFMKRLNLAYFHHYRQSYGWVGHFWQDRFKSRPIGKDAYFIQCGKYIELNPVKAGLVQKPEDYRYSSYNYYVQGKPNKLLTPDFLYEEMGKTAEERQEQYRRLIVDQDIEKTYSNDIWGSDYQRYKEQEKIDRKLKREKEKYRA